MRPSRRQFLTLAGLTGLAAAGPVGCGSKQAESTPNPDLGPPPNNPPPRRDAPPGAKKKS